jgi:hypothetical protein
MTEEWRECVDFPNYEVSSEGNVRNKRTGKTIKQGVHHGYKIFYPYKDGKDYKIETHIQLCKAFIANPENKPCVDHKDGDYLNNKISNLRWATRTENAQNRKKLPSKSQKSGVYITAMVTYNGHTIRLGTFPTVEEASEMYEAVSRGLFGEFYRCE